MKRRRSSKKKTTMSTTCSSTGWPPNERRSVASATSRVVRGVFRSMSVACCARAESLSCESSKVGCLGYAAQLSLREGQCQKLGFRKLRGEIMKSLTLGLLVACALCGSTGVLAEAAASTDNSTTDDAKSGD